MSRSYNDCRGPGLAASIPSSRFGPFTLDGLAYRLLKAGTPVELSPKALDLLFLLTSRPGTLVTKDDMLAALWPDVAVTDNALTQVVSELRQALGDHPAEPTFVQTVPRRGYRFLAEVRAETTAAPAGPADSVRAIAVLDFTNVTADPALHWLSAGIAETVANDLRAIRDLRVIDRALLTRPRSRDAAPLALTGLADVVVTGSFQRMGDQIRIVAQAVDPRTQETLAKAKADGPVADVFQVQDEIVTTLSSGLRLTVTPDAAGRIHARETTSLEAYRAVTEGRLKLETLDVSQVDAAIADFERAIKLDPDYALAHVGRAHARFWLFQASRRRAKPDADALAAAIADARRAIELDGELAEAHAALAFFLAGAERRREAVAAGRIAVALEPANWRHQFRLGVAAWGEERRHALEAALAVYPQLAYASMGLAMLWIARGDLGRAGDVLKRATAWSDRQPPGSERFPSHGPHWLLGLIAFARGDAASAEGEFEREQTASSGPAFVADEFGADADTAHGFARLAGGDPAAAEPLFQRALARHPQHGQALAGLALARERAGDREEAVRLRAAAKAANTAVAAIRPTDAAVSAACLLVTTGRVDDACVGLLKVLEAAPLGPSGWSLPVEVWAAPIRGHHLFQKVLARLAARAK